MTQRIFAIPDIHGRNDLLTELLRTLREQHDLDCEKDKLIFLGDMIDRGEDSKGVLDTIMRLDMAHDNVIALLGNHEDMMLNALTGNSAVDMELWVLNGGGKTLNSFGTKRVPQLYRDWLSKLSLFHEEPGFFFSHAPIPAESYRSVFDRNKPYTRYEYIWTFDPDEKESSRKFDDGKIGVCGHIHAIRKNYFGPRFYDHYLFLDAGCGCHPRAPLVATEVTTRNSIAVYPAIQREPFKFGCSS